MDTAKRLQEVSRMAKAARLYMDTHQSEPIAFGLNHGKDVDLEMGIARALEEGLLVATQGGYEVIRRMAEASKVTPTLLMVRDALQEANRLSGT